MGTLFKNTRVEFIENSYLNLHNYLLDGEKELIGVTSLIKKHGLAEGYDGISPVTLQVAAEIGTAAHRCIESYCNGDAVLDIPLLRTFQQQNIRVIATEYLMSDNETVASSMDLLAQVEDADDTFDIIDIKRTEKIHHDALHWQLGFYRWLFLLANPWAKVRGCYCLHVRKGMKSPDTRGFSSYSDFLESYRQREGYDFNPSDFIRKDVCEPLIEIIPAPEEDVLSVVDAERRGVLWSRRAPVDTLPISAEEKVSLPAVLRKVALLEEELKTTKAMVEDAKSRIYEWMVANGRERLSLGDSVDITLKRPTVRRGIDAARLREDYADIAAKYATETPVKGSLIIKIK